MRYKYFTPLVKFDLDPPKTWAKIGKLKIKRISDAELLQYFGIKKRGPRYRGIFLDFETRDKRPILNEIPELKATKYALVADLDFSEYIREVVKTLSVLRLFELSGVTSPVTFGTTLRKGKPFLQYGYNYPLKSNISKELVVSGKELEKVKALLGLVKKIRSEDMDLLKFVVEHGASPISLVMLVTILERTIMRKDRNEISFKVRLFGAKALSKYFGYEESKVFRTLGKAYGLRSEFIHEGKSSGEIKDIFEDLYDCAVKLLQIDAEHPNVLKPENRNDLALSA
jgi:hypothetical protein